ncbi:MAG TPA: ParB/RepB/Spo0J family partition protein [Ilumatobacteraceae bacterium]|nr:ParB/RepB/Spo0J family partition protein [Ilumatobacteraceae bacterium]
MARLSGLGKGLGALIPADTTGGDVDGPRLEEIPVGNITPNPNQPRVHFDEEALSELTASVGEIGVLQPIQVRPLGDGQYELIAGERRWRAARRAGLAVVPAIVTAIDDVASVERALVENLHREDLTALEEASGYQQLAEDFEMTHEQIAVRMGKSRSTITNSLRLLSLPAAIQHLLADGRLSAGHARALLGTPDRAFQEQLAKKASSEGWSVRMLEDAVRERTQSSTPAAAAAASGREVPDGAGLSPATRLRPPGLLELEQLLADHLSTRVNVTMGTKKGKVVIEFADLEDLERIYHQMTTPSVHESE